MVLETQEELFERANSSHSGNRFFDDRYPIWQCPDCGLLNRFVNTFMELCNHCEANHTLDWTHYIIDKEIQQSWV